MKEDIKELFKEYEKAFNALDVEKQVPLFAQNFISAGPRGSIALGRDEFARKIIMFIAHKDEEKVMKELGLSG